MDGDEQIDEFIKFAYENKIEFYEINPKTHQPFTAPNDSKYGQKNGNLVLYIDKNPAHDRYNDQLAVCWKDGYRDGGYGCYAGLSHLKSYIKQGRMIPIDIWETDFSSYDLYDNLDSNSPQ